MHTLIRLNWFSPILDPKYDACRSLPFVISWNNLFLWWIFLTVRCIRFTTNHRVLRFNRHAHVFFPKKMIFTAGFKNPSLSDLKNMFFLLPPPALFHPFIDFETPFTRTPAASLPSTWGKNPRFLFASFYSNLRYIPNFLVCSGIKWNRKKRSWLIWTWIYSDW